MYCVKCGSDIGYFAFCPNCGTPSAKQKDSAQGTNPMSAKQIGAKPDYSNSSNYINPSTMQYLNNRVPQHRKTKNNSWIILLVVVSVVAALFMLVVRTGTETGGTQSTTKPSSGMSSGVTAAISEESYKNSCESVKYEDIARNPDKYKGKNIFITGKVLQVLEPSLFETAHSYRIRANGKEWYVTYELEEGQDRILADDSVTIYGQCTGVTTVTRVLGSKDSVPSINAKYIDID